MVFCGPQLISVGEKTIYLWCHTTWTFNCRVVSSHTNCFLAVFDMLQIHINLHESAKSTSCSSPFPISPFLKQRKSNGVPVPSSWKHIGLGSVTVDLNTGADESSALHFELLYFWGSYWIRRLTGLRAGQCCQNNPLPWANWTTVMQPPLNKPMLWDTGQAWRVNWPQSPSSFTSLTLVLV